MTELAKKKCVACEGEAVPLARESVKELLAQLDGWIVNNAGHLAKEYKFPDFVSALAFVNRAGETAEQEAHHPDIYLAWGKVRVEIWTHAINGLSENDFILAAKLDSR